MATQWEEEGTTPAEAELGEFFDFQGATESQVDALVRSRSSNKECPSHPNDSCLCHGFISNDVDADNYQQAEQDAEYGPEDYASFQDWIPRFVKPDECCDYCRSRNLQCYLSYGNLTCTACDTLFRSCSFAKVANEQDGSPGTIPSVTGALDTLHTVAEDVTQERGALTGTRVLKSRAAEDRKSNPRFSRDAVRLLKEWVDRHQDNPYPSEEEKADLGKLTGLRYGQINTWFANARRRGKVGRGRPKGTVSPTVRPSSPIGVPSSGIEVMSWENMNPLERWKHSPPTNEAAPIEQIRLAIDKNELPSLDTPSALGYTGFGSSRDHSGTHSHSNKRAPSMTSLEQLSSHSSSAAWSGSHDSFGSYSSFGSGLHGKRERRRRRKVPQTALRKTAEDKTKRVFQCTFCTDTFKSKYDWTRHEKTLHLSLEKFICCPLGPEIVDHSTGGKICAYCQAPNPDKEHLETHGHRACVEKGLEARTFFRKDHLRQHLRLMHNSQLLPHMEAWKVELRHINSRCGFCAERFQVWQERVDHIATHFKEGKKMVEWKGCRGLDPNVAANVLNAMPPYLIGIEQGSLDPFSATAAKSSPTNATKNVQSGGWDGSPATCWEILTVRLGRFAKEQADAGVLLTDELLQKQARLILYDDPDPWNQTAAENPEWLDLFKRAHGLDFIPDKIGGIGSNVPDDLELYGDLGVRIPFCVQVQQAATGDVPPEVKHLHLARDMRRDMQQRQDSQSSSEASGGFLAPKHQRYSSLAVPYDKAKHFETVTAPYPESGVRGQVQYTRELSRADVDSLTPADMAALLGVDSNTTPSDPSVSTPNIVYTDLLNALGYNNQAEVLCGLGVGAGMLEAPSTTTATTPQGCINNGNCQTREEMLVHLGLHPNMLSQTALNNAGISQCCGSGESGCSATCTKNCTMQYLSHLNYGAQMAHPENARYTSESFPNPVNIETFASGGTGEGLSGGAGFTSTASFCGGKSQAAVGDMEMDDVFMGRDGDFDFNDMSFDHAGAFGDVDFGMFDARTGF